MLSLIASGMPQRSGASPISMCFCAASIAASSAEKISRNALSSLFRFSASEMHASHNSRTEISLERSFCAASVMVNSFGFLVMRDYLFDGKRIALARRKFFYERRSIVVCRVRLAPFEIRFHTGLAVFAHHVTQRWRLEA